MTTVVLVIHLMIAVALCSVVLLQRSEGGALGMGGGGGGGFMTGRGTANLLTRTTAWLGVAFFVTSIVLTLLAQPSQRPASPLDARTPPAATAPAVPTGATPVAPAPTAPTPAGAAKTTPATPATPAAPTPAAPKGGLLDDLQKGKLN